MNHNRSGRSSRSVLAITWALLALNHVQSCSAGEPHWQFIANDEVKVGVRLDAGGSVAHFGPAQTDENFLNHYDLGRFLQQSFYGAEDGSLWAKKPWRWNPVQGGDYRGNPAQLLAWSETGHRLSTRGHGKNWAGGQDLADTLFEQSITLTGPLARIDFRFTYSGEENHPLRSQEVPALFVDARLTHLVCYTGDLPWTDAPLTRRQPGWPNESVQPTERWAAYVDDSDRGVGIFFPHTDQITCYRYAGDHKTGPTAAACSYLAPLIKTSISPGTIVTYNVHLTYGTVDEIRQRFKTIAETSPVSPSDASRP